MDKNNSLNVNENFYYLFYQMMTNALQTDDVFEGLGKSLYLLKNYLNCGDIVLHRKSDEGIYNPFINEPLIRSSLSKIGCIVNKAYKLIEYKKAFYIDLNLSDEFKNVMMVHINTGGNEYILSVSNVDNSKSLNENFQNELLGALGIILKRADMYEKNTIAINLDILTGLKNRTSYENRIHSIDTSNDKFIYGIFDLFRLKYINDNYSHSLGDRYIIEVASILNRYWPENTMKIGSNDLQKKIKTDHYLYRIGGDEFALLTTKDTLKLACLKAKLVAEEVSMINLGTDEKLCLGLNYGLVEHNPGDTIKKSYVSADEIMQENKSKMYVKYGIERRI